MEAAPGERMIYKDPGWAVPMEGDDAKKDAVGSGRRESGGESRVPSLGCDEDVWQWDWPNAESQDPMWKCWCRAGVVSGRARHVGSR
jgi:hypothetical protein